MGNQAGKRRIVVGGEVRILLRDGIVRAGLNSWDRVLVSVNELASVAVAADR